MDRRVISPLVACVIAIGATIATATPVSVPPCPAPHSVAHRGLSGVLPENTLPALQAAADVGVDAVEMDVRFTDDDVPVLMHDDTVDRTTSGSGPVSEMTWSQARQLGIPSWPQALKLLHRHDVQIIPEIKRGVTDAQLAAFLEPIERADEVVVTSFRPTVLRRVAERSDLPLGLLTGDVGDPVSQARAARADYYMPRHDGLRAEHVAALHDADIDVVVWTPDDPVDWERLAGIGVDGVITNRAAVYEGWTLGRCAYDGRPAGSAR